MLHSGDSFVTSMTNGAAAPRSETSPAGTESGELSAWKVPEIMATIGPTLEKQEDLRQAIQAGVRWIRLPCGYRERPHVENARIARAAALQAGHPVELLLDLPSSRPRTGTMPELTLKLEDKVVFWGPEPHGGVAWKKRGFSGSAPRSGRVAVQTGPQAAPVVL